MVTDRRQGERKSKEGEGRQERIEREEGGKGREGAER